MRPGADGIFPSTPPDPENQQQLRMEVFCNPHPPSIKTFFHEICINLLRLAKICKTSVTILQNLVAIWLTFCEHLDNIWLGRGDPARGCRRAGGARRRAGRGGPGSRDLFRETTE